MLREPEAQFQAFARDRSEAAFRVVYDATTPGMLGLALRLSGGDRATAEDLVQESWLRAVDRAEQFIVTESVARWLAGFVINCWREHHRTLLREAIRAPADIECLALDRSPLWSESPVLSRAVDAMPAGYRAVLVLHDIEGYTHAEIASQLGIQEGTSKSQLARARRQLRELLGAEAIPVDRTPRSPDAQ